VSVTEPDRASEEASGRGGAAADDARDEELTIQQASQLLDVPAPTIRSWERRYGVPLTGRSSGGHRRYARVQLDQLRRMRDLIARGRRPVEAAALVKAGHATSPGPLVEAFLQAALELAPGSIARTLDAARETLGLDRTVDEVLLPAMREVGEWWHSGRIDISHEHLATNATQAWLAAVRTIGPLRPQPPIILSCGPQDHHTLGLEAIGALLRQRQWDCRMLGARTPAESLARAVAETDAVAVVLVSHVTAGREAAVEALHSPQLRQRHVFYAGGAFGSARARHRVPGHYLGTSIAEAAELITATVASALAEKSG
jgi:DNA-binding transcriptional MerR regulator/methylmalonyl-CoA mutase cobalamin-binding subunit